VAVRESFGTTLECMGWGECPNPEIKKKKKEGGKEKRTTQGGNLKMHPNQVLFRKKGGELNLPGLGVK